MSPTSHPYRARLLALLSGAALLAGCSLSPRLDQQFGRSVRLAQHQQTLHPEAARNDTPVNGLDAEAAAGAQANYQRAMRSPESQNRTWQLGNGGATH